MSCTLAGASDPILQDLVLDRVEPMQGDRHVLVVVQDPCGHGLVATLAALDGARGFLREALAASVQRRRVPQLSFSVLPTGGAR